MPVMASAHCFAGGSRLAGSSERLAFLAPQGFVEVQLIWSRTVRGYPRRRHIPDVLSIPAEKMFGKTKNEIANFGYFKGQKPAISNCPIHPKLDPRSMTYAVILSFGSLNKSGLKFLFSAR
jgi:hypothetical protein